MLISGCIARIVYVLSFICMYNQVLVCYILVCILCIAGKGRYCIYSFGLGLVCMSMYLHV